MKIKKIINYLFGFLVVLLFAIGFSDAEVIGISQSEWNSKPDSYWFSQSCDEVVWNEVYSGEYQIYLDNFENPSSNHGALYIWNYKVLTRGNYILYNNSNGGSAGNGLVIFNRDYLQSIDWKVNPGQTVRHLTTAEEVNGATFQWNWSFNTPYHAGLDGMLFHTPNFRSDGSHPNTPTPMQGNGYGDAEIRAITLYDSDNNLNTSSNNRAIVECWRNVIRRCGDGIVDTNHGETCDEGTLNGTPGHCNTSCNGTTIQNPQCSSTYNNQIQYTPDGSNWLSQNMNLCTIGSVTNFQISWNPGNSRHFTWNCTAGGNSTDCIAYQQWCGDGKVESNYGEACDPADTTQAGRGNGGCSDSCQPINVQNPQCNSTYNGQTEYTSYSTNWLNNTMDLCTIGTVSNFNYSGTPRVFTWNCAVSGSTSVSCSANQQRCGDGQLNGSEECDYNDQSNAGWNGMQCDTSCHRYTPGSPVPYILKQQKTGGMSNFTSNQLNVQDSGVLITYKVNFGNSGTVAATGEVRDILPPCVDYVSSTISLPAGVQSNGPIVSTWNNQDMVKYKDFRLDPNKGGYMTVVAYIRGTGYHGTTNCANVTSYINTGYFKFVGGTTLNSQVIAVRPKLSIHKQLLTTGNLTAGSTVSYKITLTNNGSATYHNAYILDIIPSAIQYQASSIQNIINYSFEEGTTGNNEYYIKYYNFNLNAGHSVVVYLTGILKQGFNFNETTNCAMTSGAVDCEEFPLSPVPYVQKYQKIGNDSDPNSNEWTTNLLTVELRQFISYRIDFGNIGNKPATGEVKDILPKCVEYIGANLVGASGNGPTYYPNTRTVQFTNIPLAAGQTAHMMVVGKIKEGDGCTGTYRYLNTGSFHFMNTPWQNSTVLAERPNTTDVEITKEVSPTGTVQQGDVVTYTINYRNKGPEVLQTYTIVDYWPTDKLDFSGVVYTNPNPSSYTQVGDNIIKRVFNTPLGVGQTGQIVIQGVVK